jgi:hypothetical protein
MNLVLAFFAGMFLANSLPHLIAGIQGNTHMTPLAKNSSALVNVVWGSVNFVLGAWIFNASGGNLAEVLSMNSFSISFLFSNPNAKFPWFK